MVTRHYKTNLDTFHKVEEMYNTTKPLVSKKHPLHHDIRPLGPRVRKWERIKKFSYNCYGLMDGGSYDGLTKSFWPNYMYHPMPKDIKEEKKFAPILWTYDGTRERIRIRNEMGDHTHTMRNTMLENALPSNMHFYCNNGRQYIGIEHGDGKNHDDYYLPKGDYSLEFERETSRQRGPSSLWRVRGNTYQYVHPKKRVDKKRKAEIKPYSDKLLEYVVSMYNILPSTDNEYFSNIRMKYWKRDFNFTEKLREPDNYRQLTSLFQEDMWNNLRDKQDWNERDAVENKLGGDVDLPTLRSRYNSFINKYCDLIHTDKGSAKVITKEKTK